MATFDYATPLWAETDAEAAVNIQTLGRLAATITDITMSLQTSSAAVLPKRTAEGSDITYGDLLFLQRYLFTHMGFMNAKRMAELQTYGLTADHVFVHTGWLRQTAEVMETMAYQLSAGRFAHRKIVIETPNPNGGPPDRREATAQDWVADLQFQAQMSVQMADDVDS